MTIGFLCYCFRAGVLGSVMLIANVPSMAQQKSVKTAPSMEKSPKQAAQTFAPALVQGGHALFSQNCAFCHGRDAGGGETGPDLTHSKLVGSDVNGDKISVILRNGRVDKGMPAFPTLSPPQVSELVAFVHTQYAKAETQKGGRRGVDVADLQSGHPEVGKQYFNGPGKCSTCHSPTGDLAGVANRYVGLKLEERMLYPEHVQSSVIVTLPSGQTLKGKLEYRDEFTVGLRDAAGWYHSWPVATVKYAVDAPVEAHAELLGKYTDDDIHNLMAYLQTLH